MNKCIASYYRHRQLNLECKTYYRFPKPLGVRTVGPVNNEVPESAMAEQPLEQNPAGL